MPEHLTSTPPSHSDPQQDVKSGLLAAFRRILRPLIRILIRNDVSFGEFSEVVKTVYVETAARDFALQDRKPSGSRIAILTGLTRKEVKRLTDQMVSAAAPKVSNFSRITRVLEGWHTDAEYTGPYGMPIELMFDSEDGPSFGELVKRYSGDMPARAMLEELKRIRAVDEDENNHIFVLKRSFIQDKLTPETLEYIGSSLNRYAATLDFNLNPHREESPRFERRVVTDTGISAEQMEEFKTVLKNKGQEFLETLDNWLSLREEETERLQTKNRINTGVGVYLFVDESDGDSKNAGD